MADKCYAPVFPAPRNALACIFVAILFTMIIVMIIIGTLGLCLLFAGCRCLIKQYQYRIKNCAKGNTNPNVEI